MKRRVKSIICVLLTLVMVLGIIPPITRSEAYASGDLPALTGIRLNGNTLSWDAFPGAVRYRISYDSKRGSTSTESTSIDLRDEVYGRSNSNYAPGTYATAIYAVGSDGSQISAQYEFDYYYDAYGMTKLDRPQNVRLTSSGGTYKFECDPVPNAASYVFTASIWTSKKVWTKTVSTNSVSVPASDWYLFSDEFEYTIGVRAEANNYITSDSGSKSFNGWYTLPSMHAWMQGDLLYWDEFEGASRYDFHIDRGGGYAYMTEMPMDIREYAHKYNVSAGTTDDIWIYALNENDIPISKKAVFSYNYDGQAPTKHLVTFLNKETTPYGLKSVWVNDGGYLDAAAVQPFTADGKVFKEWVYEKSPSRVFDPSKAITERTILRQTWRSVISRVEITPKSFPQEGMHPNTAAGSAPEDALYTVADQYYISGNTGNKLHLHGTDNFEGGCEYLWVVDLRLKRASDTLWDDLDNIEITVPAGMTLFNKRIDNNHLFVTFALRTAGSSDLEIVDATDVTIRAQASNLSAASGTITVTNTGNRKATVSMSYTGNSNNYIFISNPSVNLSFTLEPGAARTVTVKPKSGISLEPGRYSFGVKFKTGSSVEKISSVTLVVEGEAHYEMTATPYDYSDTENTSITVKEGYNANRSGWNVWLGSDYDIDEIEAELTGSYKDKFQITQVVNAWSPAEMPFDYSGGDVAAINIRPIAGLTEGTYPVTLIVTGYEMKTITLDLTLIVEHNHDMKYTAKAAPSCTEEGLEAYYRCSICSKIFRDEAGTQPVSSLTELVIPKLPHVYGAWQMVSSPTETTPGSRVHYCTKCGHSETEEIPCTPYTVTFHANGHGTEPEPQEVYHGDKCINPGDLSEEGWAFLGWYSDEYFENLYDFSAEVTKDLDLYAKWDNVIPSYIMSFNVSLSGKLYFRAFTVPNAQMLDDDGAYFAISYTDASVRNAPVIKTDNDLIKNAPTNTHSSGVVRRTFEKRFFIAQLHDGVSYALYDHNGYQQPLYRKVDNAFSGNGNTVVSTPWEYLEGRIANSTDPKMVELAKAIEYYGTAAQLYFGYNTEDIPSSALTALNTAIGSSSVTSGLAAYDAVKTGTLPAGIKKYTSSLVVESDHSFVYHFYLDGSKSISNYSFYIDFKDGKGYTKVTPVKEDTNKYCIQVSDIPSGYLSRTYKFKVTGGSQTIEISASALSYAYGRVLNSTNPNMVKMAKALYLYSMAANAYFGTGN